MNVINANDSIPEIGYQAENNRTQVRFPMADIMTEFPGGITLLAVQRPMDKEMYVSSNTEMDGTDLVWTVENWALARKGFIRVQVVYVANSVVAKTRIYRFRVSEGLLSNDEAPPGWEDWVTSLLEAAGEVNSAIEAAETTLDGKIGEGTAQALKAEGYAAGTQDGEPVEEGSEYYEKSAAYFAGQAEAAAQVADSAAVHAPEIAENGNWQTWDQDSGAYVDTGRPSRGVQGPIGETGAQGPTGATGAAGNGIVGIEKTGTSGAVDTYTISYTNGGSDTLEVTNAVPYASGATLVFS